MSFALQDNSVGRADPSFAPVAILPSGWTVPFRVVLEGGGKIPLIDAGLAPVVMLTRQSDGNRIEVPLTAALVDIPFSASPDYRVSVVDLSRRYRVKSMSAGRGLQGLCPGPFCRRALAERACQPTAQWHG